MSFITDTTGSTIYTTKVDVRPVPGGETNTHWAAADGNQVRQALIDVRSQFVDGLERPLTASNIFVSGTVTAGATTVYNYFDARPYGSNKPAISLDVRNGTAMLEAEGSGGAKFQWAGWAGDTDWDMFIGRWDLSGLYIHPGEIVGRPVGSTLIGPNGSITTASLIFDGWSKIVMTGSVDVSGALTASSAQFGDASVAGALTVQSPSGITLGTNGDVVRPSYIEIISPNASSGTYIQQTDNYAELYAWGDKNFVIRNNAAGQLTTIGAAPGSGLDTAYPLTFNVTTASFAAAAVVTGNLHVNGVIKKVGQQLDVDAFKLHLQNNDSGYTETYFELYSPSTDVGLDIGASDSSNRLRITPFTTNGYANLDFYTGSINLDFHPGLGGKLNINSFNRPISVSGSSIAMTGSVSVSGALTASDINSSGNLNLTVGSKLLFSSADTASGSLKVGPFPIEFDSFYSLQEYNGYMSVFSSDEQPYFHIGSRNNNNSMRYEFGVSDNTLVCKAGGQFTKTEYSTYTAADNWQTYVQLGNNNQMTEIELRANQFKAHLKLGDIYLTKPSGSGQPLQITGSVTITQVLNLQSYNNVSASDGDIWRSGSDVLYRTGSTTVKFVTGSYP